MPEPSKTGRRTLIAAFALATVVLLSCCGGAALFWDQPKNYIRMMLLQRKVDQELPRGSTQHDVESWCNANGFGPLIEQEEAPAMFIRSTAFKPMDTQWHGCDFGIDFYFDPKNMTLMRQVAFRCHH